MSKIYAVEYRYVTDKDEEMAAVRPSHRAFNGRLADEGRTTPDCTFGRCSACGACPALGADNELASPRTAPAALQHAAGEPAGGGRDEAAPATAEGKEASRG